MNRLIQCLIRPHFAVLAGVSLSFVAWAMPPMGDVGKGFVSQGTTFTQLIKTIVAYLIVAGCCALGYYLGKSTSQRFRGNQSVDSRISLVRRNLWTIWIVLASIGVLSAAWIIVGTLGVRGCVTVLASFNANTFKHVIYSDYSIGLLTLRYVAILAAAIALFRFLAFKEISPRSIASLGLLLFVSLISSRLSVVWACVIGTMIYLLASDKIGKRKIAFNEMLMLSTVVVVFIGGLTVSRTLRFYQENGSNSVVAAVGSEFQRYLAAPFQGSIEAVNFSGQRSRLNETAGIDSGLTTNSAFMELATLVGRWNVIGLGLILFISGAACGVLQRYRDSYLIVAFGVLQCCHFEIWRLLMFPRGITITIMVFALSTTALVAWFKLPELRIPTVRVRLR